MPMIDEFITTYFNSTPVDRVSYSHFLNQFKERFVDEVTDLQCFDNLDGQLYRRFKASMPIQAPSTALRRAGSKAFWIAARLDFQRKRMEEKQASTAIGYEEDATDLLNDARQTAAAAIRKNLKKRCRSGSATNDNIPQQRQRLKSQQQTQRDEQTQDTNTTMEDPFSDVTPGDRIRSAITKFKTSYVYVKDIHKQDLLYYGIVDLIPTSSTKLYQAVETSDIESIKASHENNSSRSRTATNVDPKRIKMFVEEIVQEVTNVESLHTLIKSTKRRVREDKSESRVWKKKVIKLLKEYRDIYDDHGSLSILKSQGEMNYISTFLAPIMKKLFKGYDGISFKWGDTALTASKEEEHAAQMDDQVRSRGTVPDGVFSLKNYDMDFSLVEVSGPPSTKNHQHHIGDRIKLAKALKQLLKKIRRSISDGDNDLYEGITLFGTQVYSNKLYVYSMQEPMRGVYAFEQVMAFELGCPIGMVSSFMPKVIKNLWNFKNLVISSSLTVTDYMNSDGGASSSANSSDSRDTVYISPVKKSRTRKTR